jgi:hypothetical protein
MTTYYISTVGNDSWDGTTPAYVSGTTGPWATFGHADGAVSAGDTVEVRGGTYVEELDLYSDGTAENRITYDNYGSEEVIIDGEKTLPTGSYYYFLVEVHGDYTTIQDMTVKRSHGAGLAINGNYSYAVNIDVYDMEECGICGNGNYVLLDGCTSTDTGKGFDWPDYPSYGAGIVVQGDHDTIQNCTSWENRGEGINCYTSTNATIQDCISYNNQAVNLYLDSAVGATARRNIIYQTKSEYLTNGILIGGEVDQPSNYSIYNNFVLGCKTNIEVDSNVTSLTSVSICYNTIVNSTGPTGEGYNMGVYFRPDIQTYSDSIFKNNIVLEDDGDRVPVYVEDTHTGLTFSYNCWSKAAIAAAQGTGDVVDDPEIDKTGDTGPGELTAVYFKIGATSPCIGAADPIAIDKDFFETDRDDTNPDIGGHEYTEEQQGGSTLIRLVKSEIR